jgi:tRNA-Thr(GGU) m(6)t(6)A37 methyltransferase TsaA
VSDSGPSPEDPGSLPLSLTLTPIGFIRSGQRLKFDARHQPAEADPESHVLELVPSRDLELGLRDLEGFSRIWLLWWFHRNTTWRPLVMPPQGPAARRGVFSTRSPHRPNPVGITPVRLVRVETRRLILGPCDLIDGTPVFDIKPYISAYDAFAGERAGWWDAVQDGAAAPPGHRVVFSPRATEQVAWLREHWGIDFSARVIERLERDPSPHRTRRIRRTQAGRLELGCGGWRAVFEVEGGEVRVTAIEPGYPRRFLEDRTLTRVPDREAQLAYLARFPEATMAGD